MNDVIAIATFVASALWNVLPAFLISVLLGVLVRALKLDGAIRRAFDARVGLAILLATAVGAFSPFCSCTVIPVVSGLLLSGVPLAPVMAFWVASPTMDPEIFTLSVATLGWPLAVARLLGTLAVSLAAGYGTLLLTRSGILQGALLRQEAPPEKCCSTEKATEPVRLVQQPVFAAQGSGFMPIPVLAAAPAIATAAPTTACSVTGCSTVQPVATKADAWWTDATSALRSLKWSEVAHDVADQSWGLGRWLVLAFVLEALITLYVPQAAIAGVLGTNNPLAIPLAALVGIPLYLSNISALPIVSGLVGQGMQPGAAIAFLIAGPVTTIPAMTAVWGIARRKVFALYLSVGVLGAMLAGFVTNLFLS